MSSGLTFLWDRLQPSGSHSGHAADCNDCAHLASDDDALSPASTVSESDHPPCAQWSQACNYIYWQHQPTEQPPLDFLGVLMLPFHPHITRRFGRQCLLPAIMWSSLGQLELFQGLTSFFSQPILWSEGALTLP